MDNQTPNIQPQSQINPQPVQSNPQKKLWFTVIAYLLGEPFTWEWKEWPKKRVQLVIFTLFSLIISFLVLFYLQIRLNRADACSNQCSNNSDKNLCIRTCVKQKSVFSF